MAKRAIFDHDLAVTANPWTRLLYNENSELDGSLRYATYHQQESAAYGTLVRELFAEAYGIGNGKAEPVEHSDWANSMLEKVRALPEWKSAAEFCEGDDIAAARLAGAVATEIARVEEPPDSKQAPALGKRQQMNASKESFEPGGSMERTIQAAVEETKQADKCAEEIVDGICGAGIGTGTRERREVRRRLVNVQRDKLNKVLQLAGSMRNVARKSHGKKNHGPSAIEAITRGGDLTQLLPSEMMKMSDPVLSAMLWANIQDRAALQFDVQEKTKGLGPIVFCFDKSGSMDGDRDVYATSAMLAMMEMARKQRRVFVVLEYQGNVTWEKMFRKPGKVPATEISEIISHSTGGGTSVMSALTRAEAIIDKEKEFKKADIVILTDGEDRCEWLKVSEKLKVKGIDMHFIGIGMPCREPAAFASVCSVEDISMLNNEGAEIAPVLDAV